MQERKSALWMLLLVSLIAPSPSLGSDPVAWSSDCCVIEGMLFSLRPTREGVHVYRITPMGVDVGPYEGKKLRVVGALLPGDHLDLKMPEGVTVLGSCDEHSRGVISPQLAWARYDRAKAQLDAEDLVGAAKEIESAIAADGSPCIFYLTRGLIRSRQGLVAAAANDAAAALSKGCNDRYPDVERIGEILEKAGRRDEAIEAYRKASSICGYAPDRVKIDEKIKTLQKESVTPR